MNFGRILYSPDQKPGSPSNGGPEFLVVGKLRRPHGLRGDVLMSVWTDFPERLSPGMILFVGDGHKPLTIHDLRWHRKDMLISFEGYHDREQAGVFRNQVVSVRADELPDLDEGEYYLHEFIGLQVIDATDNKSLGVVVKIIETGANDVFLIRTEDDKELLLPDIESVVKEVDIDQGIMRVIVPTGLLPDA